VVLEEGEPYQNCDLSMMTSTELLMAETSVFNVDMTTEQLKNHKSSDFYQIPAELNKTLHIQQHFT
jgi:hypothetical protein